MSSVLVAIVLCGTLIYLARRAEPFVADLFALARERIAAASREPARQEAASIPADLFALAQAYQEPWAREQAMQAMREMYGEAGSWDMVRLQFGRPSGPNENR